MSTMAERRPIEIERCLERFWEAQDAGAPIELEQIERLVRLAGVSDAAQADAAVQALFAGIVEPLNDSFRPADRRTYVRVFARVIQLCRRMRGAERFDSQLSALGVSDEADLIRRAESLDQRRSLDPSFEPRTVALLSRVTPGADVAITSAALAWAGARWPRARLKLIGAARLAQLFGGETRLSIVELTYRRRGGLLDRFAAWSAARELIEKMEADDLLLIDPDSRIAQLGLLPLLSDDGRYLFFNGSAASEEDQRSLSELLVERLEQRAAGASLIAARPFVALSAQDNELAGRLIENLGMNKRRVVGVSFGVGGNQAKRVGAEYERQAVRLLLERGWAVLLDRGTTPDETAAADRLAAFAADGGWAVQRIGRESQPQAAADLACWDGDMGGFAALVGTCERYLGYDSMFQHVAAAQAIPLVAVFNGFRSPLFPKRWRPCGPARVSVIEVAAGDLSDQAGLALKSVDSLEGE